MGSPSGGADSSSSSGNSGGPGGSGGNDNDRGNGPSGNDRDSGSDNDRASRSDKDSSSDQRGMTGSERAEAAFNDAVSQAAGGPDPDDDDNDGDDAGTSSLTDSAGETFGGLSSPAGLDNDTTAEEAAQTAARESHHANEFDGLGPSGGPVDNSLPGDDSRNSHRGYGPDDSLAGGIDDDVNTGLEAAQQNHPANEFGGLGPSSSSVDDGMLEDDEPGYGFDIARAGITGSVAGLGYTAQQQNLNAINSVADRLGTHPTSNLPAHPDFNGSNKAYAAAIQDQKTAKAALENMPQYKGGVVRETLEEGAKTAKSLGRAAIGVGMVADPAITAVVSGVQKEGTPAEKITEAIVEGGKRIDNAAVATTAGLGAAAATMAMTSGVGTLAAPGAGGLAGAAADKAWSASGGDDWFDSKVEDARPHIQSAVEETFEAIENPGQAVIDIMTAPGRIAADVVDFVADSIDEWSDSKKDEALSRVQRQ